LTHFTTYNLFLGGRELNSILEVWRRRKREDRKCAERKQKKIEEIIIFHRR